MGVPLHPGSTPGVVNKGVGGAEYGSGPGKPRGGFTLNGGVKTPRNPTTSIVHRLSPDYDCWHGR